MSSPRPCSRRSWGWAWWARPSGWRTGGPPPGRRRRRGAVAAAALPAGGVLDRVAGADPVGRRRRHGRRYGLLRTVVPLYELVTPRCWRSAPRGRLRPAHRTAARSTAPPRGHPRALRGPDHEPAVGDRDAGPIRRPRRGHHARPQPDDRATRGRPRHEGTPLPHQPTRCGRWCCRPAPASRPSTTATATSAADPRQGSAVPRAQPVVAGDTTLVLPLDNAIRIQFVAP